MKIAIIGDVHYGQSPLGTTDPDTQMNTRLLDFIETFNNTIDNFVKNDVKTVVLVGDVFDKRNPSPIVIKSMMRCLMRAVDKGIEKILINIGNHDQVRGVNATTLDFLNELKLPNIKVFPNIETYSLSDDFHLVFLPYTDRRALNAKDKNEAVEILKTKLKEQTDKIKGTKILIAHLMLEKEGDTLNGEEYGLNELVLPLAMFSDFSAVVSGHIHKPQVIQEKPPIICSGSMDRCSFGEREHQKVSIIMDDQANYILIPTKTRNLIDMRFDYSAQTWKKNINEAIVKDIENYDQATPIKDAIVKIAVKVQENDSYYVSQAKIKNALESKNIKHCASIYINTVNVRQLRDEGINETISPAKAIETFIGNLSENEEMKKKLIVLSHKIIKEVG